MFIQVEPTPNPLTLKFLPGCNVMKEGTIFYKNESEASFYYTISGSNNQQYQRHQLASTFVFDSLLSSF